MNEEKNFATEDFISKQRLEKRIDAFFKDLIFARDKEALKEALKEYLLEEEENDNR